MNCRYSIEYTQIHAPGRTRTSDQQLRRLLLYPPELRARDSAATTHFAKLNAPVPPEPFAPQAVLAARDTAPLLLGASMCAPGSALRVLALLTVATIDLPRGVCAQTDEIQVYNGGLAPRGVFNLTLHNNFIANGLTTPAFAGGVVADQSLNGVPEWAYGVTAWFEAGLYLPLHSMGIGENSGHASAMLNGVKLRMLFAVPRADDRTFVYGVNFELSYNAKHWDPTRVTSEIRPIIGW